MASRRWKRRVALCVALVASLAAHAAAIVFLADRVSREGMEAATDAVSVEIVLGELDLPPTPPVAGADSQRPVETDNEDEAIPPPLPGVVPSPYDEAIAPDDATPEIVESATPVEQAPDLAAESETSPLDAEAQSLEAETNEPLEAAPVPVEDSPAALLEAEADAPPPPEQSLTVPVESEIAEPVVSEPSPAAENAEAAVLMEEPAYEVALPDVASIPLPTARPEPPARIVAGPRSQTQRPAARQPAPTRSAARQAPARQQQAAPAPASPRGAAAGATRGDPAAYSRQLLAHVERHKTYPAQAQRQRISGATRLSITIDRNGRLQGARVTQGSGHAILDDAALGVARRAAPYPRPPEGVGGGSISFAVTLRFSR